MKNFIAYQKSVRSYEEITKLKLPYFMRDQILRASSSIALNLAEGSGKGSMKDQRRFYLIALGSLRETQAVIELNKVKNELILSLLDELGAMVWKLIKSRE